MLDELQVREECEPVELAAPAAASAVGPRTRRPTHTVQEVLQRFSPSYHVEYSAQGWSEQMLLRSLCACRTAAMGGHLLACPTCGHEVPLYNQCQNRSCPTCQGMQREQWIEQRMRQMLPVGHFHVVFTLPAELRELSQQNPTQITYKLIHQAAWETLRGLAEEQLGGAQLGVTIVLHTWSRAMIYHPHAHCIVTSGGLSRTGDQWVCSNPDFLFSIEAMRDRFRDCFLAGLRRQQYLHPLTVTDCAGWDAPGDFERQCTELASRTWIAYIQAPFTDVSALTKYLGQYTHQIAISDWRILEVGERVVRIATRDGQSVELEGLEFVRRFLLHVPPKGKSRIHHYGLYSAYGVHFLLAAARSLVAPGAEPPPVRPTETWDERLERVTGEHPRTCPCCHQNKLVPTKVLLPSVWFYGQFLWRERRFQQIYSGMPN